VRATLCQVDRKHLYRVLRLVLLPENPGVMRFAKAKSPPNPHRSSRLDKLHRRRARRCSAVPVFPHRIHRDVHRRPQDNHYL
jgi:hypothetical protein